MQKSCSGLICKRLKLELNQQNSISTKLVVVIQVSSKSPVLGEKGIVAK